MKYTSFRAQLFERFLKEYFHLDEPDSRGTLFKTGTLPAHLAELTERDPHDFHSGEESVVSTV